MPMLSATGATIDPQIGAVMSSHTVAVGRISSTRRVGNPLAAVLGYARGVAVETAGSWAGIAAFTLADRRCMSMLGRTCYTPAASGAGSSSAWQSTTFGTW